MAKFLTPPTDPIHFMYRARVLSNLSEISKFCSKPEILNTLGGPHNTQADGGR
jgi:hypothetical protein